MGRWVGLRTLGQPSLRAQLTGAGVALALLTALALAGIGFWQGNRFKARALQEGEALVQADLDHITESVLNLIHAQDMSVREKVEDNLRVAKHVLGRWGKPALVPGRVTWKAVNQVTGEVTTVALGRMHVGARWLGQNDRLDAPSPVVDQICDLVGGSATLFQRMNARGDMIRVATTVPTRDGRRAIGTFIPAWNPDGTPNPVVSEILQGRTYRGSAYVVNAWHMAAYEPLRDARGEVFGMLYVGIRQERLEALRQAIMKIRVGRTGYIYLLGARGSDRGHYLLSKDGLRDGEDIWESRDARGHRFIQSIIRKASALKPGEFATERYPWQNPGEPVPRWKVCQIAYYEPWDWVIAVSAYEDELQAFLTPLAASHRAMTRMFLGAALAIGSLGCALAWLLARRLADPILGLAQSARAVAVGDFSREVAGGGSREVLELAAAFQVMRTEVQRREEELQVARNAAEAASLAKSRFLATMSHELRTPLNAVLLYSELIAAEARDAGQREGIPDLDRIQEAARSLLGKIDGILAFIHLEHGTLEVRPAPFAPAAFLRKVEASFQPEAHRKGVVLEVHPDPELPDCLLGDCAHLERLVGILVDNALKFTPREGGPPGRVELTCRLDHREADQVRLAFVVRDNGMGIPPALQARLFQPFTLADDSTSRRFEGVGLSTAICARMVTLLGGHIQVDSAPGAGSAFTVHLPFTLGQT